MFDIGFWELTVVAIVALIVIGPDKLPGLARTAGLWIGKARHFLANVKADIDRELKADELRRALENNADVKELKDILSTTRETIESEANPDYLVKAVDSAADDAKGESPEADASTQSLDQHEPVKTEAQLQAEANTRRYYDDEAQAKQAARAEAAAQPAPQPTSTAGAEATQGEAPKPRARRPAAKKTTAAKKKPTTKKKTAAKKKPTAKKKRSAPDSPADDDNKSP